MLSLPARPQLDRAQILKAAASIGVVGTGSHSAPRMMAMLCNPRVSARDVASLVDKEPAMYARVLRVANSPYYGQARSIASIDRALVLLGLDAVRGIVAAACLDRTLALGSDESPIDLRALACHSFATAVAAESLARIQHQSLASEAFIAGLLHNLGIAMQISLDLPGINAMIDVRRTDTTSDIRLLESQHAAVGHEECIAAIFEEWQLPPSLVAAVRHHHDPMGAPVVHRALAGLVNLGANLGLACGNTFTLEPGPVNRNLGAMTHLGLAEGDLNRVEIALPGRVAELRSVLLNA